MSGPGIGDPEHSFFIAIDSDGCVFDTMALKHQTCFAPALVDVFDFQAIESIVSTLWIAINLDSRSRGRNRFLGLQSVLGALMGVPEAAGLRHWISVKAALDHWLDDESAPSLPALQRVIERDGVHELKSVCDWSLDVDRRVSRLDVMEPFSGVREVLVRGADFADMVVISQTPEVTVRRDWAATGLEPLVRKVLGQESGSKSELLAACTGSRYSNDRILMIGDAPGDRLAAEAIGALFFPVIPGQEEQSWALLIDEGLRRFRDGTYRGVFQDERVQRFYSVLPEWRDG